MTGAMTAVMIDVTTAAMTVVTAMMDRATTATRTAITTGSMTVTAMAVMAVMTVAPGAAIASSTTKVWLSIQGEIGRQRRFHRRKQLLIL